MSAAARMAHLRRRTEALAQAMPGVWLGLSGDGCTPSNTPGMEPATDLYVIGGKGPEARPESRVTVSAWVYGPDLYRAIQQCLQQLEVDLAEAEQGEIARLVAVRPGATFTPTPWDA